MSGKNEFYRPYSTCILCSENISLEDGLKRLVDHLLGWGFQRLLELFYVLSNDDCISCLFVNEKSFKASKTSHFEKTEMVKRFRKVLCSKILVIF